jgi:hypothetical protein
MAEYISCLLAMRDGFHFNGSSRCSPKPRNVRHTQSRLSWTRSLARFQKRGRLTYHLCSDERRLHVQNRFYLTLRFKILYHAPYRWKDGKPTLLAAHHAFIHEKIRAYLAEEEAAVTVADHSVYVRRCLSIHGSCSAQVVEAQGF